MTNIVPLITSFGVWILGELYVLFFLSKKDGKIKNKGSSRMLDIGTLLMFSTSWVLVHNNILNSENIFIAYAGMAVTLIGVSYRQYSIYVLGEFFNGNVRIKNNHDLIQHGPYRMLRHPSYFGSVIAYLGLGLSTSNLISIIILPLGISLMYVYRTKVEEEILTETFGVKYVEYKKRTWGFLPFQG